MNVLDGWRREIRALIPRGFLRRDQGNGLFISDYPRFGGAEQIKKALENAGYRVDGASGPARIDAAEEKYCRLLLSAPPERPQPRDRTLNLYALAGRLSASSGALREDNLPQVRETLKLLDARDLAGLYRYLSPAAAEAQRRHAPLPPGLGDWILYVLWDSETEGE